MSNGLDVIVVGGGPVGIATSLLLATRGLKVRVLESATGIYDLPRAIVMDDEIQRVFQNVGLTEALRAITTPMAGAEFVKPGGEQIMGVEFPEDRVWPLGHHPTVAYYQPQLEEMLRRCAVDAGVELLLGLDVAGVTRTPGSVTATTRSESGERTHTASWLIAADGAASPIRKALGIAFLDQGFDQDWLVLDVRLKHPVPSLPRFAQQICDPARPTTFVPGHADYRRWEFQLLPGEQRDDMTDPVRVWQLLEPWIAPDDATLIRAVVYRFHATVAQRVREGRILLAGDAAHQMPPFLGQGLCSGIRDSVNLAWKLELVESGKADASLLDTYGDERLPHAAGVVAHAVDTGRLIDQLSGRVGHEVRLDAAYGGSRPFPRIEHGLIHGDHQMVGRQLPQPSVNGVPLDELLGTGYAVLVRDGDVDAGLTDRLGSFGSFLQLPAGVLDALLPPGGAVIVRPDRYVAAVVTDLTGLEAAFDAVLPGTPMRT